MPRFIFFTKTRWPEPPRIRHQLARLLAGAGHEVLFCEKPGQMWESLPPPGQPEERITLLRHCELMHHKLRLTSTLHELNAAITKRSIRRSLRQWRVSDADVVVNFNYEYFFLREIVPGARLITVINDDFVSRALFGHTRPAQRALERTCRSSDRVLTVSLPLQAQLRRFCDAELFLPWADHAYRRPRPSLARNTLLFWGYINARIDFGLVRALLDGLAAQAPDIELLFVGPVEQSSSGDLAEISSRANVKVLSSRSLDDLPLDRILAGIIPYRSDEPTIEAISLSNKALQILARGIPLLIAGMPNFIAAPFVYRMNAADPLSAIRALRAEFDPLQPQIETFVSANTPQARLAQFFGDPSAPAVERVRA
jgi:hypothetical protein